MRTAIVSLLVILSATAAAAEPETIYGIAHVKKGFEEQFRALDQQSWDICVRHGLVKPGFRVVLQGVEDGEKPVFLVVFTWKDAEFPDHPPQELQDVWTKMRAVCEKRLGRPSMEITEMRVIEGDSCTK